MPVPTRNELKQAILWCARMCVNFDGTPYPGPISVRIFQPEEANGILLKQRAQSDGTVPPTWVSLGSKDAVDVPNSELLRVLLSPDEQKLLKDLLVHQPCSASSVQDRCKATLAKSAFWEVWSQLQKRELVEQGDDDRYRIGPECLSQWLQKT